MTGLEIAHRQRFGQAAEVSGRSIGAYSKIKDNGVRQAQPIDWTSVFSRCGVLVGGVRIASD